MHFDSREYSNWPTDQIKSALLYWCILQNQKTIVRQFFLIRVLKIGIYGFHFFALIFNNFVSSYYWIERVLKNWLRLTVSCLVQRTSISRWYLSINNMGAPSSLVDWYKNFSTFLWVLHYGYCVKTVIQNNWIVFIDRKWIINAFIWDKNEQNSAIKNAWGGHYYCEILLI